jgi:peptidoglycan/LPS O-acetylase OafA/YrhL
MKKVALPPEKVRIDIQALRGFAVLVVAFYHAKISFFSAGYLGVDIFFVISGFLITRMIKDGIEKGSFSFSDSTSGVPSASCPQPTSHFSSRPCLPRSS